MSRHARLPMLASLAMVGLLLLLAPSLSFAQETPNTLINAALADMSNRIGTTITLDDLANWRWDFNEYPTAALGCPQAGQSYAQVVTNGYQLTFVYNGATYDYRANENGTNLFLCSGPAQPPAIQPTAAPTQAAATQAVATQAPAQPTATQAGRSVCDNAMNTRLAVGQQARVRTAGLPVNVRAQASASSARAGQFNPGDTFAIIGGPTCAENLVWWNVRGGTITGWIGEGANGVYWIEPTGSTAAVTPAPTTSPGADAGAVSAPRPSISEDVIVHNLPEGFRREITVDNAAQVARQLEYPVNEIVTGAAWSPDRVLLAITTESGLRLYNMVAFRNPPRIMQVPNGPTNDVTFNGEGTLVATAHNDTIVRVWDVSTGGLRGLLRAHTEPVLAVAFAPNGALLASGGGNAGTGDDSNIRLWDVDTRQQTTMLSGHTGAVTALAFSPDGALLASGGLDGTVRFWDVASTSPGTVLTTHEGPVRDLAFSPDGGWLASVGDDGQIHLWEIGPGQERVIEGDTPLGAVSFNVDGTILATGGANVADSEDDFVTLWDLSAGEEIRALPLFDAAPDSTVTALAFDALGISLVEVLSQESQGVVRIWGIVE